MAYQEPDGPIKRDFKSLEVVRMASLAGLESNCYGIAMDPEGNIYATVGTYVLRCKKGDTSFKIYAGASNPGHATGTLASTRFSSPLGLYWHEGSLYVAHSHGIIRLTGDHSQIFAGKGDAGCKDGPALDATFNNPTHLVHLQGSFYVADTFNHMIRRITEGIVSVLVKSHGDEALIDGPFGTASMRYPRGICVGPNNSLLVVQSSSNGSIRKIDLQKKEVQKYEYKQLANYTFSMDVIYTSSRELIVCDTTAEAVYLTGPDGVEHRLIGLNGVNQLLPTHHAISRSTASCVSPEGDLYLSSEKSSIVKIKRMFPPRELADFDFSSTLEFTAQALSDPSNPSSFVENKSINDLVLIQQSTGRAVAMSAHMTKLLEFSTPNGLESCIVPFEAIESFLKLLCGQHPSIPRKISASEVSFYTIIAEAMGAPHELKQILSAELSYRLTSLTFEELSLVAAESFSVGESSSDLKQIFAAETSKRRGFAETKADKEIQDLMTSLSLSVVEPLETENPQSVLFDSTSIWFQSRLAILTERLSLDPDASTAGASDFPHNFTFEIPSADDGTSKHIKAHDWILMPRWSFFRRMMQSGLDESHQHKATLPSDFPPETALFLIQYIYSGVVDQDSLSTDGCEFLLQNAAAYGITDLDDTPFIGFEALYHYCKANAPSAVASRAQSENQKRLISV